ncbi:hypothetical protein SDJN02_20233, partial [Cucurbita argyrosperma subsp. argyrosperma]
MKGDCGEDLECYGKPQTRKKIAAEDAAEGAVWYLKHLGYVFLVAGSFIKNCSWGHHPVLL